MAAPLGTSPGHGHGTKCCPPNNVSINSASGLSGDDGRDGTGGVGSRSGRWEERPRLSQARQAQNTAATGGRVLHITAMSHLSQTDNDFSQNHNS